MALNMTSALGALSWPRAAVALIAAAFMLCGTIGEASAKSRHHHHHAHKHHGHKHHSHKHRGYKHRGYKHRRHHADSNWRNANASIAPTIGGRSFSGIASFYGSGTRTASGARYNPSGLTCAHRSLPFGTRLRVTHAGRSVVVTVNDRGPFIRGRVLDLSTGAARAVGLTSRGVGRVVAEVM